MKKTLLFFFLLCSLHSFAQNNTAVTDQLADQLQSLTKNTVTDIVYLQTSKSIYEHEEDFWFKAWVLDSQLHQLSPLDKTLYVTLIKVANDSVVFKEKYQIENGTTDGYIFISNLWTEGEYWLSAYSEHSFYSNQIPFYATQKIRIISQLGMAKEAVSTKEDNAGTKPLQFNVFPEGGDLVSGLENNLAFKAVDEEGKPIMVSGVLYENGKQIATITPQYTGMGKINFTANATKQYHIVLEQQPDITYPLPIIKKQGIQLQLELQNDKELIFKVAQSLNLPTQKIYLRAQTRGMVQFLASVTLKDSLRGHLSLERLSSRHYRGNPVR